MSHVIDSKLFGAIARLNDEQKEAVLVFVDSFLERDQQNFNKWKDNSFVSEMESRYNYYKDGGKMVTAEESKQRISAILEGK